MKIRLFYAVVTAMLSLSVIGSYGQLSPKLMPVVEQFGKNINADLAADNLHGSISVAIIKNDKVLWLGAYGYARTDANIPADTNTIYRVGSITKSFTATLLMQMLQEGKMKLDDPVENYVPEVKNLSGYAEYPKITLVQLASHTSGLAREPNMKNADVGPLDNWESKVLECIPNTHYNSAPGTQFLYSNIGYALLGLAIERAANTPYMDLVQQRIFTPLHMTDSFFAISDDKLIRLAQGINNDGKNGVNLKLPVRELKGRGYRVPNGGIFSTPRDLSKFVMSMAGFPEIVTKKSWETMLAIPSGGKNYGLGLMIFNANVYGHNGSVPGYTSQYSIDQSSGYAVILMRNYNHGSTNLDHASLELLRMLKQAE